MYHGARKDGAKLVGWKDVPDIREAVRGGYFNMGQDARLLGKNIGRLMSEGMRRVFQRHPLASGDPSWFLPHYSSNFFRPEVDTRLPDVGIHLPPERIFTNLSERGNTGAAAIFVMLDELLASGRAKPGETIMCFVPESARFSMAVMLLRVVG